MKNKLPKHSESQPKEAFEADGDYFKDLEKSLLSRVKKGAFVLESDIPLVLVAPDGYFAHLEQDIFDETINIVATESPTIEVSYKRNWTPIFRVAALLVAILGIGWATMNWSSSSNAQASSFDGINDDEILAYLESASIDENLFIDVFEVEINELNVISEPLELESEISEEDLEYFLSEDELLEI